MMLDMCKTFLPVQNKYPATRFICQSTWLLFANFSQNKSPATSNWLLVANFTDLIFKRSNLFS